MSVSLRKIPSTHHLKLLLKNAIDAGGLSLSTLSQFVQRNRTPVLATSAASAAAISLISGHLKTTPPPNSFFLKGISQDLGQIINQLPIVIPVVLLITLMLSNSFGNKLNSNAFLVTTLLSTTLTASAAILFNT